MVDPHPSQKGFLLRIFSDAKPLMNENERDLLIAENAATREKMTQDALDQRQEEIKLSEGVLTREQVSRRVNNSRISGNANAAQKRQAKNYEAIMFKMLLHQIRERYAELEAQMAKRYEVLRKKYGDDVIGGMASSYLSEESLAVLLNDEQRLQALADTFLDAGGDIKSEYQHLEEAKYVRDWNELQSLKPVIAQYDGRDDLTASEQQEILEAAKNASLSDNKNKIELSDNSVYKKTVNQSLDDNAFNEGAIKAKSDFDFH